MENKSEGDELYIPTNCPPLDYIVQGFTGLDLTWVGGFGIVGLIIAINIVVFTGNTIKAVFCVVAAVGLGILIFHRDRYTENVIDKIRIEISYYQSVKAFIYEYVDIYKKLFEEKGSVEHERGD